MNLKVVIEQNLNNDNLENIIKKEIFKFAKDSFLGLSYEEKLERSKSCFSEICSCLNEFELLNPKFVNAAVESLNKAIAYESEQYLYKIIYERDKLKKQIIDQKDRIRAITTLNCKNIENYICKTDFKNKDQISKVLNDRLLYDTQMLGILKETTESAFLTTIEMGDDVEDTAYEIAKNIVYLAINEGDFTKERFINIARVVIKSAASIANESKIYAKELVKSAINGSNDGISKAIEKFKDELKFAPDEIGDSLNYSAKELMKIEEDFIILLKDISLSVNEPASIIVAEVLQSDYDSYFARLRRISAETREQIMDKIDEISHKRFKLTGDLNIDERISNLKKEIGELEKKASQKLTQIKSLQTFENAKTEAKKLGDRVYEAAKNLIDSAKKK